MYCPKCGNDLRGDRCGVCGYDRSSDWLLYPTLTPVDPGMSRADPEEERLRSMYETALAVERAAATEAGFSAAALLYEQLGKPGWRDSAERARQCRAKVRQMEREEQERAERQRREQERQEQERRERVRQERERRERERLEQERREQERRERDRAEREHLERERLARERERQEQERLERERIRREQERAERERQAAARRTVSAPQPARVQPQPVRIQPRPQDWVRSGVPPQAVRQSEGKKKKKGLLGVLVLLAVLVALYLWLPAKLGDLPVARDLSNVFKSTASPRQTARPTVRPTVRPTARPTAAPTARPTAAPTARPATDLTVTGHVTDWAGMLSEDMRQELDALAGELSDAYQIDIRIITEGTISDEAEMEQFSDNVMERFDLGYGDDRDCILILYFYSTGRYYLISSGYGEYAFDHYGLRMIISDIHDYMADSDWYNGFYLFLEDCAFFMDRALDGDPVREES